MAANSKRPLEFRDRNTKELIPVYMKGEDVMLESGTDLETVLADMQDEIDDAGGGTVKSVTVNGTKVEPNANTGDVDLGTVITAHQDISGKADKSDTYTKSEVDASVNAKYTKPSGGIPASDLASGVIPDVSGKADKSEMSVGAESNGKRIVTLKSGTSVEVVTTTKTVNNESILGNGNITIPDGEDGITPHIGQNGNWYIGSTDTNVKAEGEQGDSGVASADGIAVRNNTTGGYVDTDEQVNVLHANVGKLLQDEIDDLEEDFSSGIIDMHVTGDTLYITTDRSRPWIRTNRSAISFGETLSGSTGKTYRVTLTWKNLTNNISVAFKSGSDSAFTKTISSIAYVDGGRHSADIDIVFAPASGATGAKAGTLVLTSGNITVEVALSGTAATVVVPTLSVSEDELNFSAMQGQTTDSQSIVVTGDNLTADATVSVSGTGVEISNDNSTFGTSAITLQRDNNGSVNATIYVRYTAGNSDLEDGLITVSSTGANSVSVDVTGTVAELPSGYTKVFGIMPATAGAWFDSGYSLPSAKADWHKVKVRVYSDMLIVDNNSARVFGSTGGEFRCYTGSANVGDDKGFLTVNAFDTRTSFTIQATKGQVNGMTKTDGLFCYEYGCVGETVNNTTTYKPYIKDVNNDAVLVTGQYDVINAAGSTPGTLALFGYNGGGGSGTAHISRLQVYLDGSLEREFVACKNSNNVYGMYEKLGTYDGVVGKFFASDSAQLFTEVQQSNS